MTAVCGVVGRSRWGGEEKEVKHRHSLSSNMFTFNVYVELLLYDMIFFFCRYFGWHLFPCFELMVFAFIHLYLSSILDLLLAVVVVLYYSS